MSACGICDIPTWMRCDGLIADHPSKAGWHSPAVERFAAAGLMRFRNALISQYLPGIRSIQSSSIVSRPTCKSSIRPPRNLARRAANWPIASLPIALVPIAIAPSANVPKASAPIAVVPIARDPSRLIAGGQAVAGIREGSAWRSTLDGLCGWSCTLLAEFLKLSPKRTELSTIK